MTEIIQTEMQEINVNTHVLVVGGGFAGLAAAKEISRSGYPVVLVESSSAIGGQHEPRPLAGLSESACAKLNRLAEDVTVDKNILALTDSRVKTAQGVPGDFTIRLVTPDGEIEKKIGAVVLSMDFKTKPLHEAYKLALSGQVMTLSALEKTLSSSEKNQLAGKTIAFMVGFAQEGNPLVMERVFRNVLSVEAIDGCMPYIYAGNLKVAADGLERIYLKSRNQGATYFKLAQMPVIGPDGKTISFKDPVMRKEVELEADVIVLEEEMTADEINLEMATLFRIDAAAGGFLQTDNVHRFPVRSNREGIFVIGGARDIQNMAAVMTDVENVAVEIKGLLNNGKIIVPKNKAILDIGKCTFCITCYRCCPHAAIYWDDTNKPVISPVACQGCGICASECPMDAIQIGNFSDAEIMDQIRNDIAAKVKSPRIVAFCCQNSAYEAGLMAGAFGMAVPGNLQVIKVPCAGKVDLDYILNAFVEGAEGVLVMACHPGNCKSEKGNTYAGWRVEDARRIMEEIGMEKERLSFVTLASNMAEGFSAAVSDMALRLAELEVRN
jgi:quinone-modifying oxidoreductase, subunit QmoB